ncbi:MAG: PQQ-binding-like beta-propeller repeat protein, partial [Planctomycetales bacterium]|nr:PQQ-binding-like beta-propeller repeat protein [Planctomycetales bacterium]
GDYILSLAPDMLTCFYKRGALQKQVQQRLRANPQDPWALRQQGAIHLSEGKTFEGVKALRQAIDRYTVLAGNDSLSKAELRAARSMLAASLLQLLRTQFADHQQLAQEITPLLETEQQRAEFHRVMAEGFGQHGDAMSALQHVLNLAKIDAAKQEPLPWEEGSRLERVDGQRQVACNRWISAIIQQLVSSSSPESSAQLIAKVVNETPASAERDGPAVYLTQLRQLVSNLGIHPRAVDARRTLIRELIGAGDLAEAIAHLSFLQSHATASQAARWTAEVAELLENHQEYAEAARLYRQIRLQWPLETLEDEQSVDEYVARKEQLSTFSTYLRAPRPWPNGATEVTATDARLNAAQLQSAVPFRVQQSTGPWDDSQTLAADSSRQPRIMVLDGAGQPIIEVMNDRNGSNKYVTQNVELSYAKIYGNVAVISLGQEIVAVDLSQNSQPRSDRILWQHAVGAPMIASRIRFRGLASQQVDTLLGIPKRSHVDSDGQLVGRLGSVSVNGVCFQELGELHCVDLLTGRHHWTRSDVDKGCELFGDDDLLFAVSPEDRELARVFSTQDGRELGHRKVVPWEATCTTLGRWQLYVSPATDQQTPSVNLALYDAWTEKDLWSQPFPVMSKSCLIGTDEIAVVQPNGAFQVMNIASGRVVVQQQLDAQSLSAVHVHRFPDRYIVATNRADYGGRQTLRYNVLGTNISAAEVSGKIYAIARDSGSQLWKKPVVVEDFAMPTYQPTGLPAFTLLKLLQSSSRGQRTMASALCLDIRDGSPIFFERNLSYTSANFQISGVPSLNMINLTLPDNKVYTIQFTTNPRSEQGPVEIPADDQDPDDKTEEDANPVPGLNLKGLPARLRNLRPGPER